MNKRAIWAKARLEFPCDLNDPWETGFPAALVAAHLALSNEEAQALLDSSPQGKAFGLFEDALTAFSPSYEWAKTALLADDRLLLEAKLCLDKAIPLSEFHSWQSDDQDIAVAAYVISNSACPRCGVAGHKMGDSGSIETHMTFCAGCDALHSAEQTLENDPLRHARRVSVS